MSKNCFLNEDRTCNEDCRAYMNSVLTSQGCCVLLSAVSAIGRYVEKQQDPYTTVKYPVSPPAPEVK